MALIPTAVTTLKSLWVGDASALDRILVIITVSLPGVLEAIGMCLGEDNGVEPPEEEVK